MPRRNGVGIELLADPTRRRIIGFIALGARRPSTVAREIRLSRPATTRQLHLLRDAGLIKSMRSYADGRAVLFAIEPRAHGPITAWLAGVELAHPTADHLALADHRSIADELWLGDDPDDDR